MFSLFCDKNNSPTLSDFLLSVRHFQKIALEINLFSLGFRILLESLCTQFLKALRCSQKILLEINLKGFSKYSKFSEK